MATYTTNYNLKKPDDADSYDIADANGNMDIIDGALNTLNNHINKGRQRTGATIESVTINDYFRIVFGEINTNINTYSAGQANNLFINSGGPFIYVILFKTTNDYYSGFMFSYYYPNVFMYFGNKNGTYFATYWGSGDQ